MGALEVLVVDGFVDVEEENLGGALAEDVGLGEVDDAAAVDEEEELDLVVGLRLLDAGEELGVAGDGVDLEVDALAAEEFLVMAGVL